MKMILLNFLCSISRPPNLPTVRNLTLTFSGDFHVMQTKEEDMIQFKAFFFFLMKNPILPQRPFT